MNLEVSFGRGNLSGRLSVKLSLSRFYLSLHLAKLEVSLRLEWS
jgi:hypothetical protein